MEIELLVGTLTKKQKEVVNKLEQKVKEENCSAIANKKNILNIFKQEDNMDNQLEINKQGTIKINPIHDENIH